LLLAAYERMGGDVPTGLERDFNLPSLDELTVEVIQIARFQAQAPRMKKVA
jgi:uncharacterized protein (UPF0276 family)